MEVVADITTPESFTIIPIISAKRTEAKAIFIKGFVLNIQFKIPIGLKAMNTKKTRKVNRT
jgi:hypothetical protein